MRNFCLKKGRLKQWGVIFEIRWGGVKIFSLACGLVGSILKKKVKQEDYFYNYDTYLLH